MTTFPKLKSAGLRGAHAVAKEQLSGTTDVLVKPMKKKIEDFTNYTQAWRKADEVMRTHDPCAEAFPIYVDGEKRWRVVWWET